MTDETPEEWLERLFEFEFCAECGGDAEDHEVCLVPGIGTLLRTMSAAARYRGRWRQRRRVLTPPKGA